MTEKNEFFGSICFDPICFGSIGIETRTRMIR